MKKEKNELLRFMIGIALLALGVYWFTVNVSVTTGFYSWRIGSFKTGGLVVVPFIAGIVWLFIDLDSFLAKVLSGVGLLLIIASVIMGTQFIFRRTNLYEYLIMLIFMFGGLGLVMSVLFAKPKEDKTKRSMKSNETPMHSYNIEDEIEELKKRY